MEAKKVERRTQKIIRVEIGDEWFAEFDQWCVERFSANTCKAYTGGVGWYMHWFAMEMGENFSPEMLYGPDVERWKQSPGNEKPNTFNLRLASLRELVRFCMARGWMSFDPLTDVEGKAEQTLAPKWLTKGERGKLLRYAATIVQGNPPLVKVQAVIHLMVYAGMRVSEVEKLLWKDIANRERSGFATIRDGKGEKTRTVALNVECRKSLEKWKLFAPDLDGEAQVFEASKRTIQRWVETALEACGLVDASAHTLRHTCAKTLVDSGAGLEVVAALLGHSSLETTRRYVTPSLDDLQAAVERI